MSGPFHHFHHQAAATHWGAEDELVGPAILSRLGQRAEVQDDAQVERNCVFNMRGHYRCTINTCTDIATRNTQKCHAHQQEKRAAALGGISTQQRRQAMIGRAARAAAASREAEMRAARPTADTERPALPPMLPPAGASLPLPLPSSKVAPATGLSAGAVTPPLANEPWDALDASLALVGLVGLTVGLTTARGAWGRVALAARLVWPTKSRTL